MPLVHPIDAQRIETGFVRTPNTFPGAAPPANDCRGFCLGPEADARGDAPGVRQFEGHDAWYPEMRCMTRCC